MSASTSTHEADAMAKAQQLASDLADFLDFIFCNMFSRHVSFFSLWAQANQTSEIKSEDDQAMFRFSNEITTSGKW